MIEQRFASLLFVIKEYIFQALPKNPLPKHISKGNHAKALPICIKGNIFHMLLKISVALAPKCCSDSSKQARKKWAQLMVPSIGPDNPVLL